MALPDKALPENFVIAAEIASAIQAALAEGVLPCAAAFRIAAKQQVAPLTVGQTADALGVHLSACQLGLFGYLGHVKGWECVAATPLAEGIAAVLQAAAESGQLACAQLWELAAQFGVARLQIGFAADRLGIKIGPCQLGAF